VAPTPQFSLTLTRQGDSTVVAVQGDLDISCEERWNAQIAEACSSGAAKIQIDLGLTTFIDSSGLRLLIVAKNAADDAAIALSLANIPLPVMRVFQLTGLLSQFETE